MASDRPAPAPSDAAVPAAPTPAGRASAMSRRAFLSTSAAAGGGLLGGVVLGAPRAGAQPAFSIVRSGRPELTHGVQSGDVSGGRGIVWGRADRASRLVVHWSSGAGRPEQTVLGPVVTPETDYTGKVLLRGLPRGQRIGYELRFVDLDDPSLSSAPAAGSFHTPSRGRAPIRFAFTGDCAGQGWGINPDWGGMRCWETMRREEPQFLINSGDCIYADGPILPEVKLPDGSVWRNLTTEAKSKVAETLDEFRGNYQYNLLDDNVRRFLAESSVLAQWDDHEVVNNWWPGEVVDYDARYRNETRVDVLAERGRRAFFEYQPIAAAEPDGGRVYRKVSYGPLLDVFMIDMRTHRAPNSTNVQAALGPDTTFLGARQLAWLKRELDRSQATWKAIAADMPIGLVVTDYAEGANPHYPEGKGPQWFEAIANRDGGPPLGRELEIADLLAWIKQRGIPNVVWFTADVHYAAAHHYDPSRAQFSGFDPFWEFVAGPINAGTFGPGELDPTFGPRAEFVKAPPPGQANLAPTAGLQFFGIADIEPRSGAMTVRLVDVAGDTLYSVELGPADA